jgi:hypothetical protein
VLASASSIYKRQTRPLVREGAQQKQDRKSRGAIIIWSWAPGGELYCHMMEIEKLCERLLAKMETDKEGLMAKLDAKIKTDKEDFMAKLDAVRKADKEEREADRRDLEELMKMTAN